MRSEEGRLIMYGYECSVCSGLAWPWVGAIWDINYGGHLSIGIKGREPEPWDRLDGQGFHGMNKCGNASVELMT